VERVEWKVSKDGYIKPTVVIKPVVLGGTTIKRATAHNAKYIIDNKIGKGTKIKLLRSGDVIPYIYKVDESTVADMPDYNFVWNKTKIDIIIQDADELQELSKPAALLFFLKKMEIKYMSEKYIEKLIENDHDTIKKILNLTKDDLLELDKVKDKMATKLIDEIKKSKQNLTHLKLMNASNIFGHGLGSRKLKLILDKYPDIIDAYKKKKLVPENIKSIDGFSDILTKQFLDNIKAYIDLYKDLNIPIKAKTQSKIGNKKLHSFFNKKKVVFTGVRSKKLEKLIEEVDGKVSSSISKNTDIVITKNLSDTSSKLEKAKKLNINIITLNSVKTKLNILEI
jgi:DNA ligase (NAD+)